MKLTKYNLFAYLTLFLIIVDLLVGLDINAFYIRAVLAFLFITIVPGLLVMLIMRIREVGFWEYLVYTVGLSISFIMFAGLAVNWILPWLNITDKPLSLWPILISFNLFLIIMGFFAYKRNQDLSFQPNFPKLDLINNIFFIIPMFFPVMAILGAFILNNNGPNTLTMIMLGGIAVYVFALVLFRHRLNENVYPWAILFISLSLLLMFSLRSWYITGWDISQELYVSKLTYKNNIWSMENYKDAYNSCLSLTTFPVILKYFTSLDIQMIYKSLYQIIFIIHSLTIFVFFKKYIHYILAFISSILYFSAKDFNSIFSTHMRQEIAFIFFGLMLLILFNKEIESKLKNFLFLIFGFSMVVSHYSTTYIAFSILLLTYFLKILHKKKENYDIKKGKLMPEEKNKTHLKLSILLLLFIFGFFWLTQISNTSNGVFYTLKNGYEQIGNTFLNDIKESPVKTALFGKSSVDKYTDNQLENYINETKSIYGAKYPYSEDQTQSYSPRIKGGEYIPPKNINLTYTLFYIYQFIKYVIIISFVLGYLFLLRSKKKIDSEFLIMIFISLIMMFSTIFLPYILKAYPLERLFQQCLVFLSFSSIIFFYKISNKLKKISIFIAILFYIGYSLFNLGFFINFSGGDPTLNLYNKGFAYDALYSHEEEIKSINWLEENHYKDIVYMDTYSELKFYAFGNPQIYHEDKIIPFFMSKTSYVYSNYANKLKNNNYWDARERFNQGVLPFNYPTDFLNGNKNKIYNNGGSEIFK